MWRDVLAKGGAVHLAERNGAIVGFASGGPQRDASLPYSGEIHALLRAAMRAAPGGRARLDVGRRARLLAQGHATAVLWVLEGNSSARRFYEALGGREVARREQRRDGFSASGSPMDGRTSTVLT